MARFIISNRLSGKTSHSAQEASRSSIEDSVQSIASFASVESKSRRTKDQSSRMTIVVDSDPRDMEAKRRELPPDVMVEPEILRQPASLLHASHLTDRTAQVGGTGLGAFLELTVMEEGTPASGVKVNVLLNGAAPGASTMLSSLTDEKGKASIAYNPSQFHPAVAIIVPKEGYWSGWQTNPQNQMVINLTPLPKSGPVGWWHQVMGINQYSELRGQGVRVGIVDTGVGPHPYLTHVQSAGSFISGGHSVAVSAAFDAEDHGSHVAGIIGARPKAGSGDFMGIAPGARIFMARVFPNQEETDQGSSSGANQGDIANAIDALSAEQQVDLINLSLGGSTPSQIELDAIQAAIEKGVLLICAAGNGNGSPVMYPAAYPQTVAVSAVGLYGGAPSGSLAAASLPTAPDHFTSSGLYLANFSNIGPQITCTGPGVGIVSTVPGRDKNDPAYADMSGTSMATPAVCGRLAALLSENKPYLESPRDINRAVMAWMILTQSLQRLNLNPVYEGGGLPFSLSV